MLHLPLPACTRTGPHTCTAIQLHGLPGRTPPASLGPMPLPHAPRSGSRAAPSAPRVPRAAVPRTGAHLQPARPLPLPVNSRHLRRSLPISANCSLTNLIYVHGFWWVIDWWRYATITRSMRWHDVSPSARSSSSRTRASRSATPAARVFIFPGQVHVLGSPCTLRCPECRRWAPCRPL